MDGTAGTGFPFLVVGAGPEGLRLRVLRGLDPGAPLRLYCRGIEVGVLPLPGPVPAEALLDIPLARLPRVPLPAMLRLAAAPDGPDLAEPWPIASPAAAQALLGPPRRCWKTCGSSTECFAAPGSSG